MNSIQANFPQILEFAKKYCMPEQKTRGIIREYLQSLFITHLYQISGTEHLSFIGGTSLRLLRGLPRFSEDLDFDIVGAEKKYVEHTLRETVEALKRENIELELHQNPGDEKTYFELRFPGLLFDLNISTNPREKLMIKVEYSNHWKGQTTEAVLFSRYGMIEQIVTNTIHQVLSQKLTAYVERKTTQPRDMYDVVWLYAQGARLDQEFMSANGKQHILEQAIQKYTDEGFSAPMKAKLQPFLFQESEINKVGLFPSVLSELQRAHDDVKNNSFKKYSSVIPELTGKS